MGKFSQWANRVDWTDVLTGCAIICMCLVAIAFVVFTVRVTFWGMPV